MVGLIKYLKGKKHAFYYLFFCNYLNLVPTLVSFIIVVIVVVFDLIIMYLPEAVVTVQTVGGAGRLDF